MRSFMSFSRDTRQNPHSFFTGYSAKNLGKLNKLRVAKSIANLEGEVWGEIAPHFVEGFQSFAQKLLFSDDVIVGVSYENEGDSLGPYLSYFVATEVDTYRPSMWSEFYEDVTGLDFDAFIDSLPSDDPRFFQRDDQTRANSQLAKREHRALMDEVYDYMEEEGIAFGTFARERTTYNLMRSGKQGNMVIVAEEYIPDFYDIGDGAVQLIGYYVPQGVYRPNMIRSTRD